MTALRETGAAGYDGARDLAFKSVGLRFFLGDKVLLDLRWNGIVLKTPHFATCPVHDDAQVRALLDEARVDAVLVRYCPTEENAARSDVRTGLLEYAPYTYRRYLISLSGTFEEYLKGLSSNTRSSIKRKVKKLAEHAGGQCHFEVFEQPSDMPRLHRLASQVADRTYQKNLLGIRIPDVKTLVEGASLGTMLGFVLHHDNRPAAYLICPVEGDVLRYEYVGYDPAFSDWSVGLVTQFLAIQKAFELRRFRLWDFGQGEGQHKQVFANSAQLTSDRYYLRPTSANRLVVRLHIAATDLNAFLRRLAERFDLKARLKRLLRRAHGV